MTPLKPLLDVQAAGAAPDASAWMSASAGTGKTQVLTARILRLLLGGVPPDRILALTFTKAGAAEMQNRLFERLAGWVTLDAAALKAELAAIRADTGPDAAARARRLFAETLDTRGGLQVQTIHGFAQSLLASFPVEAGITPGFAALDDRDAAALRHQVLTETIESAGDDAEFLDDIGEMAVASGEARLAKSAGTLVAHYPAIRALGAPAGYPMKLRRALGLPTAGSDAELMTAAVAAIDEAALRRLAEAHRADGGAKALTFADHILGWLGCSPDNRVTHLGQLCRAFHTKEGVRQARLVFGGKNADPAIIALAGGLYDAVDAAVQTRRKLDAVALAARHLRVGARLGAAYAGDKARAGVIDYDDMIASAARLLTRDDNGAAWVRFKLDSRIDHLLLDEAQDTNGAQWRIVEGLTDEFFAGQGAREVQRTLFVVGDHKQAIFGFQGTEPGLFTTMRDHFRQLAGDAQLGWRDLAATTSFRSVPAVLEVVDAVAATLGEAMGTGVVAPHGHHRDGLIGRVTLWPGVRVVPDPERSYQPGAQEQTARRLAQQIAAWLDPVTGLDLPARGRRARAGDILVLVRKRDALVRTLVGALHALNVPVAGADRMRLTAQTAVQDCLALIRFALQPGDDLACAELLTSPFIGLTPEALHAVAFARKASLWSTVRDAGGQARDFLDAVLAAADYAAPYEFLEHILSGPLAGRRRLLARLGEEARDPLATLLGQALAFEAANAPSLQGFLAWIERDDIELKRDPEAASGQVRIMTVHGAKGLQSPIVVLADATRSTKAERDGHVMLPLDPGDDPVPVFFGTKAGRFGRVADEFERKAADTMEEHWRLLYVALTRAEDLLFIGGALADDKDAPADSWHAMVERAMLGKWEMPPEDVPIWGPVLVHRAGTLHGPPDDVAAAAVPAVDTAWATVAPPIEARPPRPLSPSAIADDDLAAPPPGPAAADAARRGRLLHTLFERLPAVAPAERAATAAAWLARTAADIDAAARERLAATALGIIADPRFADLFGAHALAEAPIAATVGDTVVAGTVDRLLVTDTHVRVVDFKTGRVPPSAAAAPAYHLRQMAAYAAALAVVFPGRSVEAALLYTADATLFELDALLLAAHAPAAMQGTVLSAPR